MIAVLAALAYNIQQVTLLRREVAGFRSEIATLKAGRNAEPEESSSLAEKARRLADQAEESISKGDLKRAKERLDHGLQLIERAYDSSGTQSKKTLDEVRRALHEAQSAVERLTKKPSKEPDNGKRG